MNFPILASPSMIPRSPISAAPSSSHALSARTSIVNPSSQTCPPPPRDGSSLNRADGETYAFFIEQVRMCTATIQSCAEHQKRMTDDVLQLSRLRSHKLAVLNAYYRPWDMVQTTLRVFGVQADNKVRSFLFSFYFIFVFFPFPPCNSSV